MSYSFISSSSTSAFPLYTSLDTMRFLLATCLYIGTALATTNYFIVKNIVDGTSFSNEAYPETSLRIEDPNTGNSTDCILALEGSYWEDARPSTWVCISSFSLGFYKSLSNSTRWPAKTRPFLGNLTVMLDKAILE